MASKTIEIFTDGACKGNPGPGGWGALLRYGDVEKEINGYQESTTNNIMELTAVIESLKLLKKPSVISITSVWRGAELQEREIYDLMGIYFDNHPNMKRLLLWENFDGHPLRKDFVN